MDKKITGIMCAMPEEMAATLDFIEYKKEIKLSRRIFYTGKINNREVVAVVSGVGKVSAALTAAALIFKFGVSEIIFTGSAGAISNDLKIGDIVLGKRFIQHDIEESFLLARDGAVPMLGGIFLESPASSVERGKASIERLISERAFTYKADKLSITEPKLMIGDIASGDSFFATQEQKDNLLRKLPTILCVEMEGAAVAQVCFENKVPFTIIRTISDTADNSSPVSFYYFVQNVVSKYSAQIIKSFFF
ncbi:MAG: 5'-methylthioadenosine/adenosylhomocysteine nucleosidase [Elusimicrobiota bacterium]|jgi:adenosylhomocysteine nucleosidase|nr:5'-methylthioadenosine/adenosylhomocysteine nucleosidase [Elusimicrobiota bacterium]